MFEACNNCESGYIIDYEKDSVKKCSCLLNYQRRQSLEINLENNNIPLRILDFNLIEDYKGEDTEKNMIKVKKYVDNQPDFNLFFYGKHGTQKTMTMHWMASQFIKQKLKATYVLLDDLLTEISNQRDEDTQNKWKKIFKNYDYIFLDEFEEDKIKAFESGWQRKLLLPLLKKRIEVYRKPIIFASNCESPDNVGEYFKGAIQDVISRNLEEGTSLLFKDNWKKEMKKFRAKDIFASLD